MITPEKALNIIAGQCSKKEYCSKEIRDKLQKWELKTVDIEKIMSFLCQHQFIDDSRFARIYAEDKFRFNHWGKQKITIMLHQKGISTDIITQALSILNTPSYDEGCFEILKNKMRMLPTNEESFKLKNKLIRFGLGRGFDYDTINRCLTKLLQNTEDNFE